MCYAAAIPYVMAAVSAYGAYNQAAAQKRQAAYQSQVADNNAALAEYQAKDAKERGDVAAAAVRRKYAALAGTQRAAMAARGLDISDGTPNAVLQDTSYFGTYDEAVTRANAAREAWGYRTRAQGFRDDAAAYGATADATNPLLAGTLSGVGTLVARKWYRGSEAGPVNNIPAGSDAAEAWAY